MDRHTEFPWLQVDPLVDAVRIDRPAHSAKTHGVPQGLAEVIFKRCGDLRGKGVLLLGAAPEVALPLARAGPKALLVVDEDLAMLSQTKHALRQRDQDCAVFLGCPEQAGASNSADLVVAWRLGRYLDNRAVIGTAREALREGGTAVFVVPASTGQGVESFGSGNLGYRVVGFGPPARTYEPHLAYPREWVDTVSENSLLRTESVERAELGGYWWWIWTSKKLGFEDTVELVPGWFRRRDARFMRDVVAMLTDAPTIVQLGVWAGKSVVAAVEGLRKKGKGGHILAVDLWRDRAEFDGVLFTPTKALKWFSHLVSSTMSSYVSIKVADSAEAGREHSGEVDMLFIDGDHSPLGVVADCEAWLPHVRTGGVVLFHDTEEAGVGNAIEKFGAQLEFVTRSGSLSMFRKKEAPGASHR